MVKVMIYFYQTSNPVANHAYSTPGTYPVRVTCIDRYGNKGEAMLSQRIKDPVKAIGPPQAQLTSNPPEQLINKPVDFDASKSKDANNGPCVSFTWDFGDNSPNTTTRTPTTKHAYAKPGTYPVRVTVKDKHGQTADATVNQRYNKGQI